MRQFTIHVQENKIPFFIELMQSFNFIKIQEDSEVFELTQAHKKILDERLENYYKNPSSYIDFDSACKEIEKGL